MSRSNRRVALAPAYILHHRPYRDTSRILEVLTREHGRLSVFARGVRGPHARLAAALQPFQLLLLSFSGRGEAAQLTGAESASHEAPLPAGALLAAFYLNELLLKLTLRHDPLPEVFDHYQQALNALRSGAALQPTLRIFEKRLLQALGYGIELSKAQSGQPVEPQDFYQFRPAQGLFPALAGTAGAICGRSLLGLAQEHLEDEGTQDDARRLLQAALAHCLEGRELTTRAVARALRGRGSAR